MTDGDVAVEGEGVEDGGGRGDVLHPPARMAQRVLRTLPLLAGELRGDMWVRSIGYRPTVVVSLRKQHVHGHMLRLIRRLIMDIVTVT